VLGVYLDV